MTLWGIDVSKYQAGLDINAIDLTGQGYTFMIARCAGGIFADPHYKSFLDQAAKAGMFFAAYHELTTDNPKAQAHALAANIIDKSIPVMVAVEVSIGNNLEEYLGELRREGLRPTMLYMPEWLVGNRLHLEAYGLALVASNYGDNKPGYGSVVYPGDNSAGWGAYSNLIPTILQFGSKIQLTGWDAGVDGDAYRGTLSQLEASKMFIKFGEAQTTPDPEPEPVKQPTVYVVKEGDTLSGIAKKFGIPLATLEALNPNITDPNYIVVGEVIRVGIPSTARRYTIQEGDTLSGIAEKFNTTVDQLLALNPSIKNPNLIYAGTVINV